MQSSHFAKAVYVIINVVSCFGSNSIRIHHGKRVIRTLKIIGNSAVNLLYGITVRTEYFTILLDRTYERLAVIGSIYRCYEKARRTGCKKNT